MPIPFFLTPDVPPVEYEPIDVLAPAYLVWNGDGYVNEGAALSPHIVTELGLHVLDVFRAAANERDYIRFVIVDPDTMRVNLDAVETVEADLVRFREMKPLLGDGKIYDVGHKAYPVKRVGRARVVVNAPCFVRVQIQRVDDSWENIGSVLATSAGVWVAENLSIPHGKQKLRAVVEISSSTIISGTELIYAIGLTDGVTVTESNAVQLN